MMRRSFLWAGLLLVLTVAVVQAHGLEPVKSSPETGSKLDASPSEVRLWFEEEIVVQGSWLRVVDDQGRQVDLGGGGVDLDDPQRAQLAAKLPELPAGVFKVIWQVTLLDGDTSSGQYWFGVGDVIVPTAGPVAAPEQAQPVGGISPLVWVVLVAGVLLIAIAAGLWFGARRKQA